MATVASISVFPGIGPHPVGLYPTTRNNPKVKVNLSAIPAAFVQNTPALSINADGTTDYTTEYFALMQFTSMVEVLITPKGADPNASGLVPQSVMWIAGVVSYGMVIPAGYNEIHVRPLT